MDISINNVNFAGEKEVLYGLKMAAKEARKAEGYRSLMQGPRPLNRVTEEKVSMELLNAYMDMAVFDDSFEKVIKVYEDDGIKELLQPEKRQFAKFNPLMIFKESMLKNMQKHKKTIDINVMDKFFTKISKKSSYKI